MTGGLGRADRGGHPAIILGGYRHMTRWLATATPVLLVSRPQDAIEARLTGQVAPLVGQPWHNLTRRQRTGGNGLRRDRRGVALTGRGGPRPVTGAKFTGAPVPITLISHRFECQTRRFFAIL
ncbi:hypothetical protein BFG06_18485 [Aeromonas caviae]|nr:hypothetical protein BFG06_18485 [Aeromonas caviae]